MLLPKTQFWKYYISILSSLPTLFFKKKKNNALTYLIILISDPPTSPKDLYLQMGKYGDGWPLKSGGNKTTLKGLQKALLIQEVPLSPWGCMSRSACQHGAAGALQTEVLGSGKVSEVLRAVVIKTAAPFEEIELLTSMTPDKFKPNCRFL